MGELELSDTSLIGAFGKARIRDFEQKHPGTSVYVSDTRGMWDVRITKGRARIGVGYFTIPDAGGLAARIRWPKGDIEKISLPRSSTLEGFLVAALEAEER